jgi:hypothetical protein
VRARSIAVALLWTLAAGLARGEEPSEVPGVRWDGDVDAALARAAREGRPVLVVVNALEEEGATRMLAEREYPSKPWGDATRAYVCLVANGETHGDGAACTRFRTIPCSGHRDVLSWALRRFSADGQTLTSPSHLILEPDGGIAYAKEYYTQDENPPFLDAWGARIAPRLLGKRAWALREARLGALEKTPDAGLAAAAKEWIASGDGMAPAAVVAMAALEAKPARRAALREALAATPKDLAPALFDDVDASSGDPSVDLDATLGWIRTALAVDPDLGDWAAARALARAPDASARARVLSTWAGTPKPTLDAMEPETRVRAEEALALSGDVTAARPLAARAPAGRVTALRIARAVRVATDASVTAADLRRALADGTRAERREALAWTTAFEGEEHVALARGARRDPHADVRLAAAVALLHADDRSGAEDLLAALDDLVEGPEVHAALVRWHGDDPGRPAGAWEPILREAAPPSRGR